MRFPATHAQNNKQDKIKGHFHPVNCTEKVWIELWNQYLKSEFAKTLKNFWQRKSEKKLHEYAKKKALHQIQDGSVKNKSCAIMLEKSYKIAETIKINEEFMTVKNSKISTSKQCITQTR